MTNTTRKIIHVTATVSYAYDVDEGLVVNEVEAVDDVEQMLAAGDVPLGSYNVNVWTEEV